MRRIGVAVLALLLTASLPAGPAPVASAATSTPASFGIEVVDQWFEGSRATLREIAFAPDGSYALVAGGIRGPATDPSNGYQLLLRYDNATGRVTPVVNASGKPMLFAVKFHPSGSHALVIGEKNTILRYDASTGAVEDLWVTFLAQYPTPTPKPGEPPAPPTVLLARGLAYRPDGQYAFITGSSLVAYNDAAREFRILEPGEDRYYKAIAVAPDSSYAIVEGGDTDEEGQARIGQIWFLGLTPERCARYLSGGESTCLLKFRVPYGLYEPNRSDPADITFHPIINASFVYGYDDTHGTILRIMDNGTSPDAKHPQADYVPGWMQANHKDGKYTDMEFRPHGSRALVTAFGDPQLMEFDGLSIRTIANDTLCTAALGHRCPELESVAWHPTGAYAVAVGLYGGMIKITPLPEPEVTIERPTPSETVVDDGDTRLVVSGNALATHFGARIAKVEVRVDDGPWQEADVGTRFNPVNWFWQWNVTGVMPGPHNVTVRATDDAEHVSKEVGITVYVALPPPPLATPRVTTENLTSRFGDFTFSWTPVEGAREYEVQDSRDPEFLTKVTWPMGDATTFESFARDNGTFWFRVRALGEPRPASAWSESFTVDVTEGRRARVDPPDVTDPNDPGLPSIDGNATDGNATPPEDDGDDDAPANETPGDDAPPEGSDTPAPALLAVLAAFALAARRRRA